MLGLVSYNSDEEEQQQEQQQEQAQVGQSMQVAAKIVEVTKDGVKNGRSLLEVNIMHFVNGDINE